MQDVVQALSEVRDLYRKVLGTSAPVIEPGTYAAFPPGVDPVRHAVEEVSHLKRFSEQAAAAPQPVAWIPPADSFATKEGMLIRMEVPGVAREDLKVFVAGGECVVRGKREAPAETDELRPLAVERAWGPFERRFALPPDCTSEKIAARYGDGVLELDIAGETSGIPGEMSVEIA